MIGEASTFYVGVRTKSVVHTQYQLLEGIGDVVDRHGELADPVLRVKLASLFSIVSQDRYT